MNFYLENLLNFIFGFVIMLLMHFISYKYNTKKPKKKNSENVTMTLIVNKYNLDNGKDNQKKLYIITSIINSFIIAFTFMIIINIKNFFYKMLVGFALIFILIYSIYEIVGKYLKRKEIKIKEIKNKQIKKGKKK